MHEIIHLHDHVVVLNHHLKKADAKKCGLEEQMRDAAKTLRKLRLEYEASRHAEVEAKSVLYLVLRNKEEARFDLLAV